MDDTLKPENNIFDDCPIKKLHLTRTFDLLEKEINFKWIIKDFIAEETVTILSGESGIGKTWIALELAKAISTYTKAFGHFTVEEPGSCIIVDVETSAPEMKRRLHKLDYHQSSEVYFRLGTDFNILDEKDKKLLIKDIKQLKAKLVVFDPFIGIHNKDENNSGEMRAVMKALREIANLGPAVFVVHHHRKQDGSDNQKLRGSSDIKAGVDSHIVITQTKDDLELSQNKCRYYHTFDPFCVRLEGEKDDPKAYFTYIGNETSEAKAKKMILSILGNSPSSRKDIHDKLKIPNFTPKKINDLLTQMAKKEISCKSVGHRKYIYSLIQPE